MESQEECEQLLFNSYFNCCNYIEMKSRVVVFVPYGSSMASNYVPRLPPPSVPMPLLGSQTSALLMICI